MAWFHRGFAAVLAFFFFVRVGLAGEARIPLKVAYSTIAAGHSVLWVTQEAGIFQKNGLDVEILFIQSSSLLAQALVGGSVPIATMGGVAAVDGNLRGVDLVLLASLKKTPSLTYLVTSKEIRRPEDLKGKKLGVSRIGSSSDSILRLALRKLGLNPEKDVAVLQVGSTPLRTAALRSGSIDGTILTVEEKFAAEKFGVNVLFDLRKLGFEFLTTDVVTTKSFIKKDEDAVRSFVRALVEGIRYYKTHKVQSMDVMAKYMRNTDRKIIEIGYDFNAEEYERKPYPSVQGVELGLAEIAHRNPKAKEAKPEQFMETKFLKDLDQSGYIDDLYK